MSAIIHIGSDGLCPTAYLLRSPGEKRKAWEDLQFAQRVASESVKVGHDDEKLTEVL